MPATSKKQQKFMGIVRAIQKGEAPAGKFSKAAQKAAKSMKKSSVKKYAKTKHDDLPVKKESLSKSQIKKMRDEFDKTGELPPHLKKIAKGKKEFEKKFKVKDVEIPGLEWMSKLGEERDYKAEYKKFQSSTKMKKYRAELNKYNRQKGTYGNGDGKDASHKGGKIVGFESQSKNRGRAEKSRLKKENRLDELTPQQVIATQVMVAMQRCDNIIKDLIKNEVAKRDKKKALELMKLYKKYFVEFSSRAQSANPLVDGVNERMDKRQAGETLKQLGGNRFIAMTGAKNFVVGPKGMGFKIGKNAKNVNYVRIDLDRGKDLYDMYFNFVSVRGVKVKSKVKGVYADQLQKMFTKHTGMYTSL